MKPRQLLIVAAAVIVAFAATFGIAKAGGGEKTPVAKAAPEPQPAAVIEVSDATVSNGVTAATGLPALKVPVKKPKESTDTGGGTSTTTTTPPSTTTNTTPPSTTTNTTPPSTTTTTPPPTTQTNDDGGPISTGGGED